MTTNDSIRSRLGRLSGLLALPLVLAGCQDPRPTAPAEDGAAENGSPAPEELYGTPAPENVRITRLEIEVPHLPRSMDGFTVAAISDLALGDWEDGVRVVRSALERASAEEPQMIALLGGFFLGARDLDLLTEVLRGLGDIQTVAVLSATDLGPRDAQERRAEMIEALGAANVQVLRNRRVSFIQEEDTLWIAGLNGDAYLTPDWRRAEMIGAIGTIPPVHLLLTHSPLVAPSLPEDGYGMVIAGGTACGRIGLPGRPLLRELQEGFLAPYAAEGSERYFVVDRNPFFVTCGVGHTFLPTRFAGPAEVALLTLRATAVEEEIDDQAETDEGEIDEEAADAPAAGEAAVEP